MKKQVYRFPSRTTTLGTNKTAAAFLLPTVRKQFLMKNTPEQNDPKHTKSYFQQFEACGNRKDVYQF